MGAEIVRLVTIKNGKVEERTFREKGEAYEEADKKIKEENIVLISVKSQIGDNRNEYTQHELSIPNEVTPSDYKEIMPMVQQIEKTGRKIDIINYCIRNGYQDYDYHSGDFSKYEIDQNLSYRHRKMLEKENNDRNQFAIVDLFIRKKLNGLTEHETKVYREYEEFNLEKILYDDNTIYALNNNNGAVITIFPDKMYASNTTKIEHSNEHKQHNKVYEQETGSYCPNNIYIQLANGLAACWIPTDANEYQLQQLDNIMDQMHEMEQVRGDIDVHGATIIGDPASTKQEMVKELEGIDSIKEHISKARGSSQR